MAHISGGLSVTQQVTDHCDDTKVIVYGLMIRLRSCTKQGLMISKLRIAILYSFPLLEIFELS